MTKMPLFAMLFGAVLFAAGCAGDADRLGDESNESVGSGGNASQAMHDATGTGDPVHEDRETEATGVTPGGETAPTGVGDASESVGSGVEAAGGGATGVEDANNTGEAGGSSDAGSEGTDPGDS